MRRIKAILVIIALLSAPLSLLVRPASADEPSCGGMCCPVHHAQHHSRTGDAMAQGHQHQAAACEHGTNGQMPECSIKCGHAEPDFGLLSPIAPTKPSGLFSIGRLNLPKLAKFNATSADVSAGFLASPFQPPRA
jgi:hypothetical protein